MSLSIVELEYIVAGNNNAKLLWMKQMLSEYNVTQDIMTLYCNHLSAINIYKSHVQHSKTKHNMGVGCLDSEIMTLYPNLYNTNL